MKDTPFKKYQLRVKHFDEAPTIKLDNLVILNQDIFRGASIAAMK